MARRKPPGERNLAAEVRAVEAGHRALLLSGSERRSPRIKVVSDTHYGKHYEVAAWPAVGSDLIVFRCEPRGRQAYKDDHLDTLASAEAGVVGCMHAALAARRLERAGLAALGPDGLWHSLAKPEPSTADPFAGLPQ